MRTAFWERQHVESRERGRPFLPKDGEGGVGEHKAPKVQASESQGRGQLQGGLIMFIRAQGLPGS